MSRLILLFTIICLFGEIHSAKIRNCDSSYILSGTIVEPTCARHDANYCIAEKGMNAKIRVTFTPTSDVEKVYAHAFGRTWLMSREIRIPADACSSSGLECPLKANQSHTWVMEMPVKSLPPYISSADITLALSTSERRSMVEEDANDLVCTVISVLVE